jgi:Holliday junction resolvase
MAINSKRKGSQGEREFARLLREEGYEARRGQQYAGSPDSPDVVGLPYVHLEIKRVERLNINDAMAQAKRDCGELIPIVAHRKNGKKWLITMEFDDWITLYREWESGKQLERLGE